MGTMTGGLGALGPALALGIPLALLAKGKYCSFKLQEICRIMFGFDNLGFIKNKLISERNYTVKP